jgi:hypothetical protein
MTRAKNQIHAVLHANLIPPYRGELFGGAGRSWLREQPLAEDERLAIRRHLADLDHRATELAALDQALAVRGAPTDDDRRRGCDRGCWPPSATSLASPRPRSWSAISG